MPPLQTRNSWPDAPACGQVRLPHGTAPGAAPSASSKARRLPWSPRSSFRTPPVAPPAARPQLRPQSRSLARVCAVRANGHPRGPRRKARTRQNRRPSAPAFSGPTTCIQKWHSYLLAPAVAAGDTCVPSDKGPASEMRGTPHRGPARAQAGSTPAGSRPALWGPQEDAKGNGAALPATAPLEVRPLRLPRRGALSRQWLADVAPRATGAERAGRRYLARLLSGLVRGTRSAHARPRARTRDPERARVTLNMPA